MAVSVRPMTKLQKYRQTKLAFDFPEQAWEEWSSRLPDADERLKFKRHRSYDGSSGPLLPTERHKTSDVWDYTIPAGRTGLVTQLFELEKWRHRRGLGAAKTILPSKKALASGSFARGLSFACGPVKLKMTTPRDPARDAARRKKGRLGRIRLSYFCGRLDFTSKLEFHYPEQQGSKSQDRNIYSKKAKAAIRHAALTTLQTMLEDPKQYRLDPQLEPLVEAAIAVSSLPSTRVPRAITLP